MDIREQKHGAVTVIKPKGPLINDDAQQLREHMTATAAHNLGRMLLDLSDVPFIDSKGLETLFDMTNELSRSGQALKLCHVNETLREVFDLTGLNSRFEQFDEVNAGVRSFL